MSKKGDLSLKFFIITVIFMVILVFVLMVFTGKIPLSTNIQHQSLLTKSDFKKCNTTVDNDFPDTDDCICLKFNGSRSYRLVMPDNIDYKQLYKDCENSVQYGYSNCSISNDTMTVNIFPMNETFTIIYKLEPIIPNCIKGISKGEFNMSSLMSVYGGYFVK